MGLLGLGRFAYIGRRAEKQSLQLTDFETRSIGQENYLKLKEGEKKDGK